MTSDQKHRQGCVDFAVVGVQKAGTTALRMYLAQHPEIGMSKGRIETHFFDRHPDEAQVRDYRAYHAKYDQSALQKVTGDCTPIYIYLDGCVEQLRKYNPKMKIIAIFRDPSERAYSQWNMEREQGNEERNFLSALLHEANHFLKYGQHPIFSYLQRGFYFAQVKRLQSYFPADQLLLIKNEDLRNNHAGVLRKVYRFLGVDEIDPPEFSLEHTRSYENLKPYHRFLLVNIYRRDIRNVEKLLDWDCRSWLRICD